MTTRTIAKTHLVTAWGVDTSSKLWYICNKFIFNNNNFTKTYFPCIFYRTKYSKPEIFSAGVAQRHPFSKDLQDPRLASFYLPEKSQCQLTQKKPPNSFRLLPRKSFLPYISQTQHPNSPATIYLYPSYPAFCNNAKHLPTLSKTHEKLPMRTNQRTNSSIWNPVSKFLLKVPPI